MAFQYHGAAAYVALLMVDLCCLAAINLERYSWLKSAALAIVGYNIIVNSLLIIDAVTLSLPYINQYATAVGMFVGTIQVIIILAGCVVWAKSLK